MGLYTSPHLVQVRERIRLDGVPISQDMFAKYFWEVWDRLGSNTKVCITSMSTVDIDLLADLLIACQS